MRVDAPTNRVELQSASVVCCLTGRDLRWMQMLTKLRADGEIPIEMFLGSLSCQSSSLFLFLSMKLCRRCILDSVQLQQEHSLSRYRIMAIYTTYTAHPDRHLQSCDEPTLVHLDQIILGDFVDLYHSSQSHGQLDFVREQAQAQLDSLLTLVC
jgi:hypothetical protein